MSFEFIKNSGFNLLSKDKKSFNRDIFLLKSEFVSFFSGVSSSFI